VTASCQAGDLVKTFVVPHGTGPGHVDADGTLVALGRGRQGDIVVVVEQPGTVRIHELAAARWEVPA
jgi:hypothetical protein